MFSFLRFSFSILHLKVAPGEMYAVVVTNEGVSASRRLEDVKISATLVENATGTSVRRSAHATVCAFTLEGVKFNHDSAARTNDAINIRLDGSTNGVYHIDDGEWTRGGATNCPACYVGGIRPVVRARFGVQPADLASAVSSWKTCPRSVRNVLMGIFHRSIRVEVRYTLETSRC